jgi:N-acetylglutamate synthase-like GNAT family acetyltransferase
MIFEALSESAEAGELILVHDGMLRFHRRRDGVVTIREILVLPRSRRKHVGTQLLIQLKMTVPGAKAVVARCPADLESNKWYERMKFIKVATEAARSGREIAVWRLDLS